MHIKIFGTEAQLIEMLEEAVESVENTGESTIRMISDSKVCDITFIQDDSAEEISSEVTL